MRKLLTIFALYAIGAPGAATGEALQDALNGIWSVGACDAPERQYYYVDGARLAIRPTGALFTAHNYIDSGKYRIEFLKATLKETGEKVIFPQYIWVKDGLLRIKSGEWVLEKDFVRETVSLTPPDTAKEETRQRCARFHSSLRFLHSQGISFMAAYSDFSGKCKTDIGQCVEGIFSMVDVTGDGELSQAEISRLIRVTTYLGKVTGDTWVENENIFGAMTISGLVAPFIASSVIEGSDYDGDGMLSMDEIFLDQDMTDLKPVVEKMTFDVLMSTIPKLFSGGNSLMSLFK